MEPARSIWRVSLNFLELLSRKECSLAVLSLLKGVQGMQITGLSGQELSD